jgi:carbamoyl-phosphate synthase large subunit
MKNILVTAANGLIGFSILRSLRESEEKYHLIGTTIYKDTIAEAYCDVFVKAPVTSHPDYLHWLLKTVEEHKIDLLIPGYPEDVALWAKNANKIRESGGKVVLNNTQLIQLCDDKWFFYESLKKQNKPYAIPSSLSDNFEKLIYEFGSPLLLKPRFGTASNGIVVVKDKNTFEIYKSRIGNELMVQQFVGSEEEEYTTSAFCDGKGGFFNIMSLKRKLSKQGFTQEGEVYENNKINDVVADLCKLFKPEGPTNFQFRIHDGAIKLLEINARISSATSIRSAFGYNESVMAAAYYLENKDPSQPIIRKGRAIRYIEDHIFYE